jgi:hypothetical protein
MTPIIIGVPASDEENAPCKAETVYVDTRAYRAILHEERQRIAEQLHALLRSMDEMDHAKLKAFADSLSAHAE